MGKEEEKLTDEQHSDDIVIMFPSGNVKSRKNDYSYTEYFDSADEKVRVKSVDGVVRTFYESGNLMAETSANEGTIVYNEDSTVKCKVDGNGTRITKHDTYTEYMYQDGSVKNEFDTGTVRMTYIDGSCKETRKDGSYTKRGADGSSEEKDSDGNIIIRGADGSYEHRNPNGSFERRGADGSFEKRDTDGSFERRGADGSREFKRVDGHYERIDAAGNKFVRYVSGITYDKNCSGLCSIHYPDGYSYNRGVCGDWSINGPGYTKSKSMMGSVYEHGIFTSKYTMGEHY